MVLRQPQAKAIGYSCTPLLKYQGVQLYGCGLSYKMVHI